jgi:triphosphoribosyl-dephospho-CoA synthase
MSSSPLLPAERLSGCLIEGLRRELYLTPKPGLVDRADCGSHPDLDLRLMERSIDLVEVYLRQLTASLAVGVELLDLVAIGRRAEQTMWTQLGTNTHKGAIFLCGLLVTARARSDAEPSQSFSAAVAEVAKEVFHYQCPYATHGSRARLRYRTGGIVSEALRGLPALFKIALPAGEEGLSRFADERLALVLMMARLMQHVEDTTALHRCGETGLARLRRDGRLLEADLLNGKDPTPLLQRLNAEYRSLHLTMGGVADLLGAAVGYRLFLSLQAFEEAPRQPVTMLPGPDRLSRPCRGKNNGRAS